MLKRMKKQARLYQTKFSFGASAAIMTNLGLIVGLNATPNAKFSIIASILVIAFADNISDSFGIHVFQESEMLERREIWISTATNFLARVAVSMVFILIVAFLPIGLASIFSLLYGLLLLTFLSYLIARDEGDNPLRAIAEHLAIAIAVIILSEFTGKLLMRYF